MRFFTRRQPLSWGEGLPSELEVAASIAAYRDRYFALPPIVECFIERMNKEMPHQYRAHPWTINHAVTIFYLNRPFLAVPYEDIDEGDIVWWMDRIHVLIKEDIRARSQKN